MLARTPLVFEGDAQADLARNPLLKARLDAANWPAIAPLGPRLAGRPGRDQGPDLGPVPPPRGQPPLDRRPERSSRRSASCPPRS